MNIAFKYPVQPTPKGEIAFINEDVAIKQSIASILLTPKGTRFMLENYGSNIQLLTFEQNDEILQSLLSYFIAESIQEWEKRIQVLNIEFTVVDESQIEIIIYYNKIKTNVIDTYIYPFYKEIKY